MKSRKDIQPKIQGWENITSIVDIIRNPSLILDKKNNILFANDAFKRTFQVHFEQQEDKNIFQVGDKQLNIPKLKKLLQEIIPKNGFFTDLEIHHTFPYIGEKIFLVSAKRVHEIIFLTIEDVTITMTVAKTLADFAKTQVKKIMSLEKDLKDLKKQKNRIL